MTRWERVKAAGWITLVLPLAVVLLSVALSPASTWPVRVALAGFCILAISRPADAMLVTSALIGFGVILSHLAGFPALRVTEVLVVASLAGTGVGALARDSGLRRALTGCTSVPVLLFGIAAIASTLVWLRVYQVRAGSPSAYVDALLRFLVRDYFVEPGDFWVVVSTAAVLEGLALYVVVAALCRVDATFFERALRMLTLGGAGLALMSVVRLGEIVLRNPHAIEALRATNAGLRISPQIGDYIAAGSYFSLCWLVALGLAVALPRRRFVWAAAGVPLIVGLYLTGSRSVIAAAVGGLVVLVLAVTRRRVVPVRGLVVFAVLATVVMVVSFRWMVGHDVAGETARQSLLVRTELLHTGVKVIASRPLFGVGIDRFYIVAGPLASPELNALWPTRKNPHNDFLRFGGELGLVGLGLFLWILTAAAIRIRQALRSTGDGRLAGLVAGLVAFLITSLASNPLMLREVSYVFWIALGLAAGHSATPREHSERTASASVGVPRRRWRVEWLIAWLVGGLLVLSVPFRARQELATVDLRSVSYGLFDWGVDRDGTRCRLSGAQATFYVDGRAGLIEIPLKGTLPSGALQQVEILVDGRLANRLAVGAEWQRLRTILPAESRAGSRRIDLVVSPSWVPAEVTASQDRRTLGVKVGEIKVLTTSSTTVR
jgi:O-antigen ligase